MAINFRMISTIGAVLASCATSLARAAEGISSFVVSLLITAIKAVAEPFQVPRVAAAGIGTVEGWTSRDNPRVDRHEAHMSRRAADRHT